MDKGELTGMILSPFRAYLTEKTGITFEKNREEHLRNAIAARLDALTLTDPREYFSTLCDAGGKNPEFNTLMDLLTIRESSFFRHRAQYEALKKYCLPQILRNKWGEAPINIWSAGCANGEEAYSIAMVVRETVPEAKGRKVVIRASDISTDALIQAEKGEYSKRAVRDLESWRVDRYFLKKGSRYILNTEIKNMVHFEYFNLADKHFPLDHMPLWDLIFCRNVIIYLAEQTVRNLLHNFYQSMTDGGYFFPGYSETLRYLNSDFVSLEREGVFIYQKQTHKKESALQVQPNTKTEREKKDPFPRKKFSIPALKAEPIKAGAGMSGGDVAISKKNVSKEKETGEKNRNRVNGILSLALENADQGKTMEAAALLGDLIVEDPLCERAYFLLAMIYRNTGVQQQAIEYLKKSAYLNPNDPVVRLHLADAYREVSENRNAAREYANVIALLENSRELQTNLCSEDFSREALIETSRTHLKALLHTL